MSALFRRNSSLLCFFCQSSCAIAPNPRNFRCPQCGCWNRFDDKGDLISEEPAMYIESLNSGSFAKRASTRHDQLPSLYGKGPFCHNCQSNQLLIINLLSNYLPSSDDLEYSARLEMFPKYRESLYMRYPPVCDACYPAVEDEIRHKDHMVRTIALGGWLNDSKGTERRRRVSEGYKDPEKITTKMFFWRARGLLWVVTLLLALSCNLAGALGVQISFPFNNFRPVLPVIVLLSLLWTVWDPTYSSLLTAQRQGRDIRVRGKTTYIRMQIIAWFSRLFSSCLITEYHSPAWSTLLSSSQMDRIYFAFSFLVELTTLVVSCKVMRLHQPPTIRLVNTNTHLTSPSRPVIPLSVSWADTSTLSHPLPPAKDFDFLTALSLSSKPVVNPNNPVFGLPSLVSATSPPTSQVMDMDWSPTREMPPTNKEQDDGSWLRRQTFFPPEKPTGLEGLLERTLLVDDYVLLGDSEGKFRRTMSASARHLRKSWWVYLLFFIPLGPATYRALISRMNVPRSSGPETSI